MQPDVLSLVNNTHAAAAESLKDAVVREGLADERISAWHVRHLRLGQWGKSMNGTQVSLQNENVRFEQSRNVRFHRWPRAPWKRSESPCANENGTAYACYTR